MKIKKINFHGKFFYFPHKNMWEEIIQKKEFQNNSIFEVKILSRDLKFVNRNECLSVALYKLPRRNLWIHRVFYDQGMSIIPVCLEKIACEKCDWSGFIANPSIPELFYGLENSEKVLKEASNYKSISCKVCSSRLPRHAVVRI